jgi:AcrR family transcriptional regulator
MATLHSSGTCEALLDSAEKLIAENGVAALRVRDIAATAGVDARQIYHRFESKDGLIAALATRGLGLVTSAVSGIAQTADPATDLVQAGLAYRDVAKARPALFAAGVQRAVPRGPGSSPRSWTIVACGSTTRLTTGPSRLTRRDLSVGVHPGRPPAGVHPSTRPPRVDAPRMEPIRSGRSFT